MSLLQEISLGARRRISLVRGVGVLTVGVVFAILGGTTALLLDLRARELTHAQGEVVSLSHILAEQTSRSFDGVNLVLHSVQDRLADGIGQKLELTSPMVHFLLRARASGLPQLASVFIADANGVVLNSSRSSKIRGHSVADQDYFAAWIKGYDHDLFVGTPRRSPIDGRWSLYVSRRLQKPDGSLRGVAVANVDLGYFEALYGSISLDFVSPIFLMLDDGTLLVSQPPDHGDVGRVLGHPGARVKVLKQDGNLKLIEEEGVRTVAYRHVSNFPLLMGVAIGQREALTPWREIAWPIGIGALLVSLAIGLAGHRLALETRREEELTRALRESNQQLRELSTAMETVRENERSRIARELHDELGQKLTGLKLEVGWLIGRLKKTQPDLVAKVEDMKGLLGETIEETRRISTELRPLLLDDLGLAAAAEWLVGNFSKRTGVPVLADLDLGQRPVPSRVATALFRVLQESLTNIMRHAAATEVQVSLRVEHGRLHLRIRDNGRGLVPGQSVPTGGHGLVGMRERIGGLGGTISAGPVEGGGFLVEVTLPVQEERSDEEA